MTPRGKKLLRVSVILAAAIVLPTILHYQLKAKVDRYRAALAARGEPMDLAQVKPPSLMPEQNSAELFEKAVSLFPTNGTVLDDNQLPAMRMVAPGKAMIVWAQPDVRFPGKGGASKSWEELDAALAGDKAGLEVLRQLPAESQFDFAHDYSKGFQLLLPALAKAKKAAQRLEASAVASLHRNDAETALKDILAIQSLAHGLTHDRLLISEMVRMAIAQIDAAASWEFLQATNTTDAQLAALQAGWAGMEFIKPFENALTMERVAGTVEANSMRQSNLRDYFGPLNTLGFSDENKGSFDKLEIRCKAALWRCWWSYPDEFYYLAGIQAVLEASRQVQTKVAFLAACAGLKKRLAELKGTSGEVEDEGLLSFKDPQKADFRSLLSSSTTAFEKAFNRVEKVEAARRLTVTAIALKRFHLKYGKYPGQLTELAPEFVATVPNDPVDGKPLRYQRNPDGTFLLYSIGGDGVNNGGTAAPARGDSLDWQDGRDWVWPQPATAAEIKLWQERLAKAK